MPTFRFRYTDGRTENLPRQSFEMLMTHGDWLVQLTALQAYVPIKRTGKGTYESNQHRAASQGPVRRLPAARKEDMGLDRQTASLAQWAERAYVHASDQVVAPDFDPLAPQSTLKASKRSRGGRRPGPQGVGYLGRNGYNPDDDEGGDGGVGGGVGGVGMGEGAPTLGARVSVSQMDSTFIVDTADRLWFR